MNRQPFDVVVKLPCAAVGVRADADFVREIAFLPVGTLQQGPGHALARLAAEQIAAYVANPGFSFDLPLAPTGTELQRAVWAAVSRIPAGKTRSYGELANELGSTAQAIGQACGDNVYPLVIPCHRVVAADGLGGFAHRAQGPTLGIKRWLLAHEGRHAFALT
jgi:methylated-DNA-[protein]-cysteine S-methyltransferase